MRAELGVAQRLCPEKVAELLLREVRFLVFPVERGGGAGLVGRIVQRGHVWVRHELRGARALLRVELEHAREEVDRLGAETRQQLGEVLARHLGQLAHVAHRVLVLQVRELLLRRLAEQVADELQLGEVVLALEERAPQHHLGEDAADGPDVDGGRVALVHEQQLRRTVPARDDVVGEDGVLVGVVEGPGQPIVAHLEVAVDVDEEVTGLQIAVHDLRRVQVLEPAQHLVDEVLGVVVADLLLGAQHGAQVRVEQLGDDVHVREVVLLSRNVHADEAEEVLVVERRLHHDFTQHALRVAEVAEHLTHLLDGELPVGVLGVLRRAHDPVCTVADDLDELQKGRHLVVAAVDGVALAAVRQRCWADDRGLSRVVGHFVDAFEKLVKRAGRR
mmetsp:Transcript_31866/g.98600  ORF Transcript_31866/g.98600 Transcript_31866/m.98600 type:complete len:389 (+) Transcript_31866:276-1442(+)